MCRMHVATQKAQGSQLRAVLRGIRGGGAERRKLRAVLRGIRGGGAGRSKLGAGAATS